MHRTRRWTARLLLAATLLWPATALASDVADELGALVAEAAEANPSIEAMRSRTLELRELAEVSNAWADPRVSVEYMNAPVDSFSIGDHPMGGVQFMLQQRLPEWGWTHKARELAEHGVERSRHAREEAEVQLSRTVEVLYWNLTLSRMLEGVTKRHLARTLELIRAARARYEVGRTGQNALLRLGVLRDRLEDDLGDFDRAERELSAGLSRALARAPDAQFETPSELIALIPEGSAETWIEAAKEHRPQLAALREEIKQQDSEAALSRIRIRPEVDVWVKYRLRTVRTPTDDGTDFFSAGVSVPIPWGSRKRGLRGQAASIAAGDGARARLAAALDQIEADLIAVEASWRRAADKAGTYRRILIPGAVAALETTLHDFSVGKAEFSTLYEAEIDLLNLDRAYLAATVETHVQRATARALTGQRDLGGPS